MKYVQNIIEESPKFEFLVAFMIDKFELIL